MTINTIVLIMDDFVASNLEESKNEWCIRLYSILTPHIISGIRSLFDEAFNLCVSTNEVSKYLMTFQNLLAQIPKWNNVIIETETNRILEKSGCKYLEDLITCVHIIQLKCLTCIRVGNKQKKIDISIPKLNVFIHKVYILVARYVYSHVYLFEKNITALQFQRNNRELELSIRECIMNAVRESVPTEQIILAYLDESVEEEEEVFVETIDAHAPDAPVPDESAIKEPSTMDNDKTVATKEETPPPEIVPSIQNLTDEPVITRLKFNDFDSVLNMSNNKESIVSAPKTLERLEEISSSRSLQKKIDEAAEEDDDYIVQDKIRILEPLDIETVDIDIQPMQQPDLDFIDL